MQLIHVTSPLLNFTLVTQLPLSLISTMGGGGKTGWNARIQLEVFSMIWAFTILGDFQKWVVGFNFPPLVLIWMVDQYANATAE